MAGGIGLGKLCSCHCSCYKNYDGFSFGKTFHLKPLSLQGTYANNLKHVNSTINFDGTIRIPKAKDMFKCFDNNSEGGGKNTHDLHLCYCFINFFIYRLFVAFIITILEHVKNINVAIHLPLPGNCCASQKRRKENSVEYWMVSVGNHGKLLMQLKKKKNKLLNLPTNP